MLNILVYHTDIVNYICKVDGSNNLLVNLLSTCKEANQYSIWSDSKEKFESVFHIFFSNKYNKVLTLPSVLVSLTLESEYNQPLVLPSSLVNLTLGYDYNQPLDLPSSLVNLKLGSWYTKLKLASLFG